MNLKSQVQDRAVMPEGIAGLKLDQREPKALDFCRSYML